MTELVLPSRRGFLGLLGLTVAAPAIVRVGSLMKLASAPKLFVYEDYPVTSQSLPTIQQITREAMRGWRNTNAFIRNLDGQYDPLFRNEKLVIGTVIRIRLPQDPNTALAVLSPV